jgi:hypothetical protein
MLDYAKDNPQRVADWRWKRAGQAADARGTVEYNQVKPKVSLDGQDGVRWIKQAEKFRRAYNDCSNDTDRQILAGKFPSIFWAYHAYQHETPARWAMESYLLARETDREVAFRGGHGEGVVTAYEALFFNVREKLRHPNYIINTVIGEAIHRGLSDRQYDLLWKLCGYMCGPYVLDMLVTKFPEMSWAPTPDAVSSTLQDTAVGSMKMKAALAALMVPVNNQTHLALLDIFNKYVEVERSTDSREGAKESILENINAMMRGLPFSVAGKGQSDKHIAHYYAAGAELRYEELMLVSAGVELPDNPVLDNLKFPEQSDNENS